MQFRNLIPSSDRSLQIWDPFENLRSEIDHLFNRHLETSWRNFVPVMDVVDSGTEIKITVEVPGVSEDDLEVTVDNDMLTIRGKKERHSEKDEKNIHFSECCYGQFSRSLRLPQYVKAKEIEAEMENGILTIRIPCDQKKKGASGERINIKTKKK